MVDENVMYKLTFEFENETEEYFMTSKVWMSMLNEKGRYKKYTDLVCRGRYLVKATCLPVETPVKTPVGSSNEM